VCGFDGRSGSNGLASSSVLNAESSLASQLTAIEATGLSRQTAHWDRSVVFRSSVWQLLLIWGAQLALKRARALVLSKERRIGPAPVLQRLGMSKHFGGRVKKGVLSAAALVLSVQLSAQATEQTIPDIRALADSVAQKGTSFTKTRRLVHWVNDSFTWSATDYQQRTPAQIIARRSGNCAELASVLHLLLDSLGVRSRWIREINVQPVPTERRQQTASQMVSTRGNRYSVFGLQHNDHVWLEVWDDSSSSWFPADPAYGVVGLNEWLAARLALSDRPKPRVAAVVPIAADMLAPFVVVAGDRRGGPYADDRTAVYLIEGFDKQLYAGALAALPSWSLWVAAVRSLSPHAAAAFDGKENLHTYNEDIARLKATYDALARDATSRGLRWSR